MQLPTHSTVTAHAWFMQHLPEIESRSRACFSRLTPDHREEAVAEVVATIYKATDSAAKRGVLARITPSTAVGYAAKHYRKGRRMAGYTTTDVMDEATRIKGRVNVVSMETLIADEPDLTIAETLSGRQDQSPYEQTRKNIDYIGIFKREKVSAKALKVFKMLSAVRSTGCGKDIAEALKISPGRVCQLKTELADALTKHGYGPACQLG